MSGYAMVMCAFCVGIVAVSTILGPSARPRTCSIKPIALPSSRSLPHTLQSIASRLTNTHQLLTQPPCTMKKRPFLFSLLLLLHHRHPQTSQTSTTTRSKTTLAQRPPCHPPHLYRQALPLLLRQHGPPQPQVYAAKKPRLACS